MRPALEIYQGTIGETWVTRDHRIIIDLTGGTPAELDQMGGVLRALNALDLSEIKARRAIVAVTKTWPSWMADRSAEQVEAMSK